MAYMPTPLEYTIPTMAGRTVVITGANSGLGNAAALVFAGMDARVVLAVRSLEKGRAAAEALEGEVEVRELDLADLGSVRSFAEAFTDPIDILINNAGIMIPPLRRTADGFESQLGTNHLGHFALTNLLLPQIRDRVVTLSSLAHRSGTIDFDDLNWERRRYRPMPAYAQSKLANLLFTSELDRRLKESSSPLIAVAAHPGLARTNLFAAPGNGLRGAISNAFIGMVAQSGQYGVLPTLAAAVADVPGNSYVGPGGLFGARGAPSLVERSIQAKNAEAAERLWTVSEELTGVGFPDQLGKNP
jgi:NAD(P)-dependent dehydrogenase (short-subunit alcohol dehydrogenase family)